MQYNSKKSICLPAIIIFLLATPLFSFSQTEGNDRLNLLLQLRGSKADIDRVNLLLKLSQHYSYKGGKPGTDLDSALYFADEAFYLSQALEYENGKNDATLLRENYFIRKNEIKSELNLLGRPNDSTRFHLLIALSKCYLFKIKRSKADIDSSLLFLEQANKIATASLSEKWQNESIHTKAVFYLNTGDIQQGKQLFKEMIDKISKPGNEGTAADYWFELARYIPSEDTIGMTRLYCFQRAIALYKRTGNQESEIESLKSIADMHLVEGKLDQAETELLEILRRYKAINYPNLHYTYDLLTVTYRYKGDFSKGIFYALKTIESMESTHDTTYALTFYSRLANMYRELKQPEKSVEWYRKVIRETKFLDGRNVYIYRDAGFLARELISLKRENEALALILDIKAKSKPIGVHATASLLASLAYCYHAMKQDRQADKYYLELMKLTGQLQKDNEVSTDVNYELGQYLMDKQQYGSATTYFQNALNAAEGTNSLSVNKDIYMMLYKADSASGNYLAALQHLMKHKILNDSIFNETKSRQIEELQIQYETARKEKDIDSLNNQNKLQGIRIEQANRRKNIILAGATLLLIIIGLLFNRYLIKQKSNHKLEAHQKELDQKNFFLETLNAEQNKLLKEKEWLIRELHHRVKNNLQMVTSLLNTQSAYLSDGAAVLAVSDSLRRMQAMSLIHQKLYQSENISSIAMSEYIKELVSYLHDSFNTGNRITFEQAIEPLDLDVSQAIPLGLIINESIVNAIKYAFPNGQTGIVRIDLQRDGPDHLLLKISDNGIGLPPDFDVTQHNSLGLDLIQGLTKQLNGCLTIENNKGVHIIIRFITLNK